MMWQSLLKHRELLLAGVICPDGAGHWQPRAVVSRPLAIWWRCLTIPRF